MSEDMQAFTARIPREVYDLLRAYTFYTRRTKGAVLGEAVRDYVVAHGDDEFFALVSETHARIRAQRDRGASCSSHPRSSGGSP